MQDVDSELAFELRRSPLRPWRRVLRSRPVAGREAPSYLPVANEAARVFARSSGGTALNLLVESAGGRSVTAHILGGAVIGSGPESGVLDDRHEVHGHPGLFVADASAIPVNLGVNPSLTITAMSERFAARWPSRSRAPHIEVPAPAAGLRPEGLPGSPAALRRLWGALPAPGPSDLEGTHRAVFIGPPPLRALAPKAVGLAGLPRWFGKRFEAGEGGMTGMNLLESDDGFVGHLEMDAALEPSVVDGAPVMVSTYGPEAPLPWRHVRDEFRLMSPGLLLGMAVLDLPFARGLAGAFVLESVGATGDHFETSPASGG
jgi:cholesterol oxidase